MLNSENFGHVMKATFLGHATVYLETNDTKILIDPFLTGNPKAAAKASDLSPEFIVLTHGHSDHTADAARLTDQITVVVADDHPAIREGLVKILESEKDIKIVAEAEDGEEVCVLYDQ